MVRIRYPKRLFQQARSIGMLCALILFASSPAHAWNGRVLRILTGDTLVVSWKNTNRTVTLYGISCPDPQMTSGKKAKKFTTTSIMGKSIKINPITIDSQNRMVALIFRNGQSFNEFLLRSGYAIVNKKQCHAVDCRQWQRFERNAYRHHKGIWADIEKKSALEKKWGQQ